jgi:hypothetical protein
MGGVYQGLEGLSPPPHEPVLLLLKSGDETNDMLGNSIICRIYLLTIAVLKICSRID